MNTHKDKGGEMNDLDELTLLGIKYHYDTESYDRIHEHRISPSGETAMPLDRGISSANAYKARNEAVEKGGRMGFTPQEVYKSIQDASQYSYETICEILKRNYFEL